MRKHLAINRLLLSNIGHEKCINYNIEVNAMKKHVLPILILAVFVGGVGSAEAVLITNTGGIGTPVTTTFTDVGLTSGPGPFAVGGGISVTGVPGMSLGDVFYNLGTNGHWETFSWVATDSNDSIVTFDLGGLFDAVGGFMNYSVNSDSGPTAIIRALAADGLTVLESYDLRTLAPISTPGLTNAGDFRGISRTSADIGFFQLQGSFLLMHDITVGEGAVPEPSSLALIAFGVAGLAAWRRQYRSR